MRRLKGLLIIIMIFLFVSCEKKKINNYENRIIGEWIFEQENPKRENHFYTDFSYSFDKNGNCESKPGFFEIKERTEKEERKVIFYGTKTKYKIEDDSLYILNLISKKWYACKIVGVNTKKLKLNFESNAILEFSKIECNQNENENFDKIIISKSPCFGSCGINNVEINKDGNVNYSGSAYNLKNGFFKSKIDTNLFNEIEQSLKKTNYLKLEDQYSADWTDDQEVSVTFVKDNKIIKSITDYGRQSPKIFRINIEPVTFLYQKLKLVENKNVEEFQNINFYRFVKGNQIIDLTTSEVFYLFNLLSNSKSTNKTFKSVYSTTYDNDLLHDLRRIETDGRYFKIYSKNENAITLDLGFNFIEKNELLKRLKIKGKYD